MKEGFIGRLKGNAAYLDTKFRWHGHESGFETVLHGSKSYQCDGDKEARLDTTQIWAFSIAGTVCLDLA